MSPLDFVDNDVTGPPPNMQRTIHHRIFNMIGTNRADPKTGSIKILLVSLLNDFSIHVEEQSCYQQHGRTVQSFDNDRDRRSPGLAPTLAVLFGERHVT